MKNFIITFTVILLFACTVKAQERKFHNSDAFKKVEELEKIKLIEALNLNESNTLRFFARRSEYKAKQGRLMQSAFKLLDQMDDIVKKDTNENNPQYKKLIDQYLNIESNIVQNRTEFINSLSDILTYQQICKLLIFEKKFRDEIRQVLFKERVKWRKK